MRLTLTHQAKLVDASFALASLIWIASLATMMSIGYIIAPFSIPLFVVGLAGRFTRHRAFISALGIGWAVWALLIAVAVA